MSQAMLDWGEMPFAHNHRDVVLTDEKVAKLIIGHFKPTGRILDPCRGEGAFWRHMPGADYCEIQEGKDFFAVAARYDWIVGNPPYSIFTEWMEHSMKVADNILYLMPLNKILNSESRINAVWAWGGVVEAVHLGEWKRNLGFPFGFPCGAVHYRRGYRGGMQINNQYLRGADIIFPDSTQPPNNT